MKRTSILRALPIIGLLLLVMTLDADTLVLRDGRRVQGQLYAVQNGFIDFQEGQGGRMLRFNREEVTGIELGRIDRNERAYPQTQAGRPRGLRERQVMVVANVQWNDTGIDVQSGQNVYFEAGGEIRWGPNRRAGPNGEGNSPNNPSRPMPNRPGASLIGRVGDSKDYFFVGNDREAIRMRSAGRLYLGINDDYLQDNTGYFRVIVYY
ncbi:MAG: hypothetical protein DMG13_31970 [Acidobacteria bacterium]|nr:MAG: hypothetical protein DMG13_31970 [Acidobacteriota bacterium]